MRAVVFGWLLTFFIAASPTASEIPADFAKPTAKESLCWGLLQRVDYALNRVNRGATMLLARAAYFTDKDEIPPANGLGHRPFVYRVSDTVDKNLPQLLNQTEKLLYKVIGKGPKMLVQVELLDSFLGNQTKTFSAADYQLNFLIENRDPQPEDIARLNHLSQRALEDFRVGRRRAMTTLMESARKEFQATVTPGTTSGPEQVPVIHLVYADAGGLQREAWIGFGAQAMHVLIEAEDPNGQVKYRLFQKNYVETSAMLDLIPDWMKPTDFTFERLWSRGWEISERPEWAHLLPRI